MDTASSALLVRLFRLSQIYRRPSAADVLPLLTGFGFTPSHFLFTRYARPSGQPAAVTALRSVCSRERESNQRESAPGIRVSLRETSLVPALLRGSSRWAIPGPSFLIWHPCQTPLCAAPPLGLLTGPGTEAPARSVGAVLTAKLLTAPALCGFKHNHWRLCECFASQTCARQV